MKDELKPCPFCGDKEIRIQPERDYWETLCPTCGVNRQGNDREGAIAAWNERSAETQSDCSVDSLVEEDRRMNGVKGYKVFNPDWTCLGFQYEVGKTYKHYGEIDICKEGFHFCENLIDCFTYYGFSSGNRAAEVIATGKIVRSADGSKACTDEITIVRELSWEAVLKIVNSGSGNSGCSNSGNGNSGDGNSGNWNSGSDNIGRWNSGDFNSGSWNSGDKNRGNWNSGNKNSGNRNSGNWNSGNSNSGDWNSGNWNSGIFNTTEPKIRIFDRVTDWTYRDWMLSRAYEVMRTAPCHDFEWVFSADMTPEQKIQNPQHEKMGGFLKRSPQPNLQKWWNRLSELDQAAVKSLPNFDANKFKKITGIEIDAGPKYSWPV